MSSVTENFDPITKDVRALKLLRRCGVTSDFWKLYGITEDQAVVKSFYIRGVGTITREYPKTLPEVTICKIVITPPKGVVRSIHLIDNRLTKELVCLEQRLASHLRKLLLMIHHSRTAAVSKQGYFTLAIMEKLLLQGYPKVKPDDNKVFNFKKQAIMNSFRKLVSRIQGA